MYNFHTTSSDMFLGPEEAMLRSGPTWHGTAIGWPKSVDNRITKLPSVSDRICGVRYEDKSTNATILIYSVYFPTTGKDAEFADVKASLLEDIKLNRTPGDILLVGTDANANNSSTRTRRSEFSDLIKETGLNNICQSDVPTFHHNNGTSESKLDYIFQSVPQITLPQ